MSVLDQSALIICTKNRPRELQSTLESVSSSVHPANIVVVDSSENSTSSLNTISNLQPDLVGKIFLIRSGSGLPHQRNVGIQFLSGIVDIGTLKVIHFLDDDVSVDEKYFQDSLALIDKHPNFVGIGALLGTSITKNRNVLVRLLLGEPKDGGKIGPSGLVSTVSCLSKPLIQTEWIAGGAMTLRASVFETFRFDGCRRMYGEDVEASIRLSKYGKIGVGCLLRVEHRSAQEGKPNSATSSYFQDIFRYELIALCPERVRKFRVLLASLILALGKIRANREARQSSIGHTKFLFNYLLGRELEQENVSWGWSDVSGEQTDAHTVIFP